MDYPYLFQIFICQNREVITDITYATTDHPAIRKTNRFICKALLAQLALLEPQTTTDCAKVG